MGEEMLMARVAAKLSESVASGLAVAVLSAAMVKGRGQSG